MSTPPDLPTEPPSPISDETRQDVTAKPRMSRGERIALWALLVAVAGVAVAYLAWQFPQATTMATRNSSGENKRATSDPSANLLEEPGSELKAVDRTRSDQAQNQTASPPPSPGPPTAQDAPIRPQQPTVDNATPEVRNPPPVRRLPAIDLIGRLCQTNRIPVGFEMRQSDYYKYEVLNGSRTLQIIGCDSNGSFRIRSGIYTDEGMAGPNAISFQFRFHNLGSLITCNVAARGITDFSFIGSISCNGSSENFERRPAQIDI